MNNITERSTYKFEINFEYPDPYQVLAGEEPRYLPFSMNQEIVADGFVDAWVEMTRLWRKKYDLKLVKTSKVIVEIIAVPESLPPAA